MSARILVGHVMDKLRELPDESVHCCVTSPPYYGLRDYGIEPQVWGGEVECEHEWGDERSAKQSNYNEGFNERWGNATGAKKQESEVYKTYSQGAFCCHCGAWRGSLGLEPTPALYVEHMVAVFREVRRVLRKDGTLWLNLGGVYAGSWGAQGRNGEASGLSANQIKNHPQFGSRTGSRGVSGGKHPSQSRQPSHAPACDTDGKARSNSLDLGSACSDHDGEDRDGSRSRHGRILRNAQPSPHEPLLDGPTDHDTERSNCAEDLAAIALLAARLSNNPALPENARDVFARAAKASASLSGPQTSSPDVQASVHSSCGCGSCGICFTYLAMKALRFKPKDLMMIPDLLALALQADGWWLRSEITWAKRAPMPESCTDRPTSATEKVFLLTKANRYYYDAEAVKEEADFPCGPNAPGAIKSPYGQGFTRRANTHGRDSKRAPPIESAGIGHRDWCSYMSRDEEIAASGKRNMRNWWLLSPEPFPEAHFATFVSEIPRRAILAGTSERGVCPKCGAPWERVVKRAPTPSQSWNDHTTDLQKGAGGRRGDKPTGTAAREGYYAKLAAGGDKTIGWQPTCSCNAGDPIHANVLDPFLGAGTTALVADRLGRNCIGIELNQKYAEMAERRVRSDAPLFAEIESTRHIAQGGK